MSSELAKTISTCSIWLAMAVIFTFGLFKMNGDAFFFIVATVILAGAAVAATALVWQTIPFADRTGGTSRNEER